MTVNTLPTGANWTADASRVYSNQAAQDFFARFAEMKTACQALDQAYTGAVMLHMLHLCPEVEAFSVSFTPESCSDDTGGYFRSIGASFSGIKLREAQEGEELDESEIENTLQMCMDSYSTEELYNAITGDLHGYDDLEFTVSRASVIEMLSEGDGAKAFAALFPDRIVSQPAPQLN